MWNTVIKPQFTHQNQNSVKENVSRCDNNASCVQIKEIVLCKQRKWYENRPVHYAVFKVKALDENWG